MNFSRFFSLLFCLFISNELLAQQTDSAYVRENYTKIERKIPMRDGVKQAGGKAAFVIIAAAT